VATIKRTLGFVCRRPMMWNLIPRHILKTSLFNISFPDNWTPCDIVKWPCSYSIVTL